MGNETFKIKNQAAFDQGFAAYKKRAAGERFRLVGKPIAKNKAAASVAQEAYSQGWAAASWIDSIID